MAQDEHTSRCSNSSSGGGAGGVGGGGGGGSSHRSSKKLKHKKVPQRGMGVAQLEKIISEEQQKKDVSVLTPNSIISPSNSCSNLSTIQKVPNFRPPSISPSPIPLPPPLPPHHLISKTDGINPKSASSSFSRPTNTITGGGGGGSNWCRLWSDGDYNFDGEKHNQNHGMDHSRYTAAFPANLGGGLPYESNPPIWPPPPNLMLQRSQHFQQPSSSSMVNVSAGTSSSTSSSVLNFQMEPPSNQSYNGNNNYQPLWPEEDKMVGMKRPYPFSLENVPIPSFHCKFPSAYVSPISRSDESASCSNGGTITIDAHPVFRENPSSSGPISDKVTKKFIDENQGLTLTRDFLKLAPPQGSQLHPSPCIGEQPQFDNGHSKDPTHLSGRSGSNPQPFLTFFPPAKTSMGQPGNNNGEASESVDLNLKL